MFFFSGLRHNSKCCAAGPELLKIHLETFHEDMRLDISMMKLYKWFLLSITKGSSIWNVIKVKEIANSYSSPLSTNINMKVQ